MVLSICGTLMFYFQVLDHMGDKVKIMNGLCNPERKYHGKTGKYEYNLR